MTLKSILGKIPSISSHACVAMASFNSAQLVQADSLDVSNVTSYVAPWLAGSLALLFGGQVVNGASGLFKGLLGRLLAALLEAATEAKKETGK